MFRRIVVTLGILPLFALASAHAQERDQSLRETPETTAKSTVYTGTLNVTVNIKLESALPAHAALRCAATAGLLAKVSQTIGTTKITIGTETQPGSSESVDAVLSEGSAVCSFVIPYSWDSANPGAGLVSSVPETIVVSGISTAVTVSAVQLNSEQVVARTYRSTSVVAQTKTAPVQDNATTTLTANTVL